METGLPPGSRAPSLFQALEFWNRPLVAFERGRARYGTPFTYRLPLNPTLVVFDDPEHIKTIFTAPPDALHPGEGAKVLEPLVGTNSVILLDGAAHMSQRKLMLPAFHGEKMAALAGLVEEVTEQAIAEWPRGEVISLHARLQRLTLDIILRAVFGMAPGERMTALREPLEALLAFGDRPISLLRIPPDSLADTVLRRVGPFAQFLAIQAEADRHIYDLIAECRAGTAERHDILSLLVAARHDDGAEMSEQEMRDELMSLLVAGHETTATSLAWLLNRLPSHPAVVARLREESESGAGDEYVTATIQESMRRRPVLPNAAPRLVVEPIEVGGRTYPAGVSLVASSYLTHHNPAVYGDPYAFRPERFLDEPPGTYTWIPFGGGRRRCLGASFAMMEMKIVLRRLLAACDVRAADGVELPRRRNITICPANGARTVLSARSGRPQGAPARPLTQAEPAGQFL